MSKLINIKSICFPTYYIQSSPDQHIEVPSSTCSSIYPCTLLSPLRMLMSHASSYICPPNHTPARHMHLLFNLHHNCILSISWLRYYTLSWQIVPLFFSHILHGSLQSCRLVLYSIVYSSNFGSRIIISFLLSNFICSAFLLAFIVFLMRQFIKMNMFFWVLSNDFSFHNLIWLYF